MVTAAALLALVATAPLRFADLKESLGREPAAGDERVRRFIEQARGTPLVEGTTAIFLVEGDPASPPRIVGDFNAWAEGEAGAAASRLERLGSSRFFFRAVELPPQARVEYLVVVGGREQPDPFNPRRVDGFSGPQSEVRMPGYAPVVDSREEVAVPRGQVATFEHRSEALGNSRKVHVYLPHGYDPNGSRRYPEAWLGDGTIYVERVGVPRILDRLIAEGRLEPVVAILVDTPDRRVEYGLNPGYRRMMVEELVPRVAAEYRVENASARRLLAPAIAPLSAADFLGGRRTTGRFALLRARYDDRFGPDAPALRDGLLALGARVDYLEAPQGHTLAAWPDLAARILLALLPGKGSELVLERVER
jgi:enterochelin esterase-like enzyme